MIPKEITSQKTARHAVFQSFICSPLTMTIPLIGMSGIGKSATLNSIAVRSPLMPVMRRKFHELSTLMGEIMVDSRNRDTISAQVSDWPDKIDAAVKQNGGNLWKARGRSHSKENLINFSEASGLLLDPTDDASGTKFLEFPRSPFTVSYYAPLSVSETEFFLMAAHPEIRFIEVTQPMPFSAEKKSPAEIAQLVEVAIREIQEKTMREKVKQVDKSNETATKSEWQDIYAQLLSESKEEMIEVSFSDAVSLPFARVSKKIKVTREEKEEAIQAAMAQGVTRAQAVKLCMKATCVLARKKMCGVKWNRHDWPSALYADVQAA